MESDLEKTCDENHETLDQDERHGCVHIKDLTNT